MAENILLNESIKDQNILLIDHDGNKVGIKSKYEALRSAQELGLDLLQVSSSRNGQPAVCKIIDYNKMKYEESKKSKKNKQPTSITKEIRFNYGIAPRDLEIKQKQIVNFLSKNYKVSYKLLLEGRQKAHVAEAKTLFNESLVYFQDIANWSPVSVSDGDKKIIISTLLTTK